MSNKPISTRLLRTKLIKKYLRIKNHKDKHKVWLAYDLGSETERKYLETLVSLGLLEKVDVEYCLGLNSKSRRNVKGYRLICSSKKLER